MGKNRIIWIDAAKGFGILLVMFSHLIDIGAYITSFYMPIFFIIAGYFMPRQLIVKKAKRLLIPYFFTAYQLTVLFYLRCG